MLIHALLLTLDITNQFSMHKEKILKAITRSPGFCLSQENLVEEEEALLRKTPSPGAVVEIMAY